MLNNEKAALTEGAVFPRSSRRGDSVVSPSAPRCFKIPTIKREIQASCFVRSSRFRTDERCQMPPRLDLIPTGIVMAVLFSVFCVLLAQGQTGGIRRCTGSKRCSHEPTLRGLRRWPICLREPSRPAQFGSVLAPAACGADFGEASAPS